MTFPFLPSERTPEQQKIARAVNRAIEEADEKFCEILDRQISQIDGVALDSQEVKDAVFALGSGGFDNAWDAYLEEA